LADPADLLNDLLHCVRAVHGATGEDVIVVDQTSREQHALGLRCVRVLAPGLLSIDFGYLRSRVRDSLRLRAACRDEHGVARSISELPHPFA
jgi:ribosomal protein S12 methylthiotransferase accessory factor